MAPMINFILYTNNTIANLIHKLFEPMVFFASNTNILPDDMDIDGLLELGRSILVAGVGVVAVAGMVYGSILYITAGGSSEKTKKGLEIIRNTVIGIILFAVMSFILSFLGVG